MSNNKNNDLKKPEELDLDLENNERALNRDISKAKPVDGYYADEEQEWEKVPDNGFDYGKKYLGDESSETNGNSDDYDSGTKLNPRLEKITEPDPDDKKRVNRLTDFNRRNRNQPL